jgi:hypothetical protein
MHLFLKLFIFALHMFRTVSPSIIRSSRLYIQQKAYVKQLLLPAANGNEMEHPVPASSRSQYLFDIYLMLMCSLELLMMDGETVRNI